MQPAAEQPVDHMLNRRAKSFQHHWFIPRSSRMLSCMPFFAIYCRDVNSMIRYANTGEPRPTWNDISCLPIYALQVIGVHSVMEQTGKIGSYHVCRGPLSLIHAPLLPDEHNCFCGHNSMGFKKAFKLYAISSLYRCIVAHETPTFEQFALCILQKHNW